MQTIQYPFVKRHHLHTDQERMNIIAQPHRILNGTHSFIVIHSSVLKKHDPKVRPQNLKPDIKYQDPELPQRSFETI